ncbi:MAG: aminotransferase class I/II-fold pyridoxal phosphate-dependent enzyme [Chloroflexota bacterium]
MNKIPQSPTVSMADRVNFLKSQGKQIIGLQTGDPDFATHSSVIEIASDYFKKGLTHYGPSQGFLDFRQAASQKLARDNSVEYDPATEIMATHGGIHAFYTAVQAILNPGDEVLVPDPTWATHANMVTLLRGKAVRVPAYPENNFLPLYNDWEKCLTGKTRAIIINYPSNPTGVYPTLEYMEFLQDFAKTNNLWIISDEVYENLYFEEHPVCASSVKGARERTIIINSLSKTYAMTGWRVGFISGPNQVIENALKASQISITCVAPFIQKAAAFALTDLNVQAYASEMRNSYNKRRNNVMNISADLGSKKVRAQMPMGAFYYFLDMRKLNMDSSTIANRILEEVGVGLVSGSAFGTNGEGFVRMTIAASDQDVAEGYRKIINWAENN